MRSRVGFTLLWIFIAIFIVVTAIVVVVFSPTLHDDLLALTNQGVVRGLWSDNGEYGMYMGIPYAIVNPDNPFGDSLPPPHFETQFTANIANSLCPQNSPDYGISGDLDCLRINVYVPRSTNPITNMPVMVWIHGGKFSSGDNGPNSFGPDFLIKHGVILATINYRLGPYGFMCLDTAEVPGNSGLKDQRKGLEWIRDNIAAFGGDPYKITVFGENAGAMSIENHILSLGSDGLFKRAILQSGSALSDSVLIESRPSAPIEIASHLGYNPNNINDALDILKNKHPHEVVAAWNELDITFQPCKEQSFDGVVNIITEHPDLVFRSGQFLKVPMMYGYNADEQAYNYIPHLNDVNFIGEQNDIFYKLLNESFSFENEVQLRKVSTIVQEYYLGGESLQRDTIQAAIDFDTDIHIFNPIERALGYYIETSEQPLYQYVFAYNGGRNYIKHVLNYTEGGATQADELGYLFTMARLAEDITPEDQHVIDKITTMWTNFAKYGDPTPEITTLLPLPWPRVTDEREFLWIDTEHRVDKKPFHDRVAFWDMIFHIYWEYFRMH